MSHWKLGKCQLPIARICHLTYIAIRRREGTGPWSVGTTSARPSGPHARSRTAPLFTVALARPLILPGRSPSFSAVRAWQAVGRSSRRPGLTTGRQLDDLDVERAPAPSPLGQLLEGKPCTKRDTILPNGPAGTRPAAPATTAVVLGTPLQSPGLMRTEYETLRSAFGRQSANRPSTNQSVGGQTVC